MEKVSIVKCSSYDKREVRKALKQSFKNINFSFKKKIKVLIKLNLLGPYKPEQAITTHPVIIGELCKILKKYNAEIYIGDSLISNANEIFKVSGIKKLSKYARIINFEDFPKKFLKIEKNSIEIPVPKILSKFDMIINIAKMKTHGLTNISLCVKNLYGCVQGRIREDFHRIFSSPKEFSLLLLEIHDLIKPQLNIIDGIIGLEGEGPGTAGRPINSGVIIASENAIAADIAGSEVMGFDYGDIYTNKLSSIEKDEIEITGDGKNIKLEFKKPVLYLTRKLRFLIPIFPKPKIEFDAEKCIRCLKCEKKCPVNAIKINPSQKCEHKKCINCLCCIEVCPEGAIFLKEHWTKKFIKTTIKKLRKYYIPT